MTHEELVEIVADYVEDGGIDRAGDERLATEIIRIVVEACYKEADDCGGSADDVIDAIVKLGQP